MDPFVENINSVIRMFNNGEFAIRENASDRHHNCIVEAAERAEHGDWKTQLARSEQEMGLEKGEIAILKETFENLYGMWARVLKKDGNESDVRFQQLNFIRENTEEYIYFFNGPKYIDIGDDSSTLTVDIMVARDDDNPEFSPLTMRSGNWVSKGMRGTIDKRSLRSRHLSPSAKKDSPLPAQGVIVNLIGEVDTGIRILNSTELKLLDMDTDMSKDTVKSNSDERTTNNTMRHQYRVLDDIEKIQMQEIKDFGLDFYEYVDTIGDSRELSLAKTKIEEAVMWAVKHITK